jgi:hypothetical protein
LKYKETYTISFSLPHLLQNLSILYEKLTFYDEIMGGNCAGALNSSLNLASRTTCILSPQTAVHIEFNKERIIWVAF